MIINFLKKDALNLLQDNISNNVQQYGSTELWISDFFEEKNMPRYTINSNILVPDVELKVGDYTTDIENSIALYESFKGKINAVQATDVRLWAYLTHEMYWEYMINRWPITAKDEDDENLNVISRIGRRYFYNDRGNARNGIARLYWAAHLTYDSTNSNDPYEYTRYFLTKQDSFSYSTGYRLSRNKTLLLATLKVLKETGNVRREHVRDFYNNLNQIGGVIVLDALDEKSSLELCKKTLNETLAQ